MKTMPEQLASCFESLSIAAMVPLLSSISIKIGLTDSEPCQVFTSKLFVVVPFVKV